MEHYRSTLTATVLAVCGLFAAAHVLHPDDSARTNRTVRVVAVTAQAEPAPTAWTDPPRRLRGPEPADLMEAGAALLAHRPMIALPDDARMAPRLSSALAAPAVPSRNPEGDPIGELIRGLDLDREG